jgi:hypothetical protein
MIFLLRCMSLEMALRDILRRPASWVASGAKRTSTAGREKPHVKRQKNDTNGRRGDLRGCHETQHAVCADQDG